MYQNAGTVLVLLQAFVAVVNPAPAIHHSKRFVVRELSKQLARTELIDSPRLHFSKSLLSRTTVREGDTVTLECSAVGVPAPTVYWRKDGQRIQQATGEADLNILEKLTNVGESTVESSSTLGRLQLDCMQPSMAGEYECVADNGFKKIVSRTEITVLPRGTVPSVDYNEESTGCVSLRNSHDESEPITITPHIYLFSEWRFEKRGNNVQLFCRATGFPRPKIAWLDENMEPVVPSRDVSVLSNGDLFLRNVQEMAQYYCVASNSAGEARMDTFLYVTKPDDE